MSDYFMSSMDREADKMAWQLITQKIYNEFGDVFTGIECFDGTFRLQVKEGSWPYQAPLEGWHMWSRSHSEKS